MNISREEARQILDALEMWVDEEAPHCDLGVLDAKLKAAITRLQSLLAEGEQERRETVEECAKVCERYSYRDTDMGSILAKELRELLK